MKKSVKFIIIGVVVLASIVGGIFYMMMPLPVRMTEVVLQTALLSFTEQGTVTAGGTVLVMPNTQGEISTLYVREGQRVNEGDPLVSVSSESLQLRLEQAQSSLVGLEAQLANVSVEVEYNRQNLRTRLDSLQGERRALDAQAAQASRTQANQAEALAERINAQLIEVRRLEVVAERAEEALRRTQILYQNGVMALVEVEAAETALTTAEAALEAAVSQLAIIEAGADIDSTQHFEGMRASLDAQIAGINTQLNQDNTTATRVNIESQIAVAGLNITQIERDIENSLISAPTSGVITTFHAQNTNVITQAAPVAEITLDENPRIEVYVSTQDINSIHVGDTVSLTLRQRASDIEFFGTITEIDTTAVVRFTALGIEERKVSVTINPETPQGLDLGVGFSVDVSFDIFREENQIVIPRTAVFRDNGTDAVWVVTGGSEGEITATPVVTGTELRTDIVILNGLNPGDFVVNDANNLDLTDGTRVVRE